MKFIVSSNTLSNALQHASKAMSPKQTMPILNYFLFSLKGDKLTITASDLESTIITNIEVENIENDGVIAIPSSTFIDVLRELGTQPITFTINEDTCDIEVKWSTGDINLAGLNGYGYPEIEDGNKQNSNSITLTGEQITTSINKTHFATATSNTRPTLNGILVDITSDYVIFVATDAYQLVKLSIDKQSNFEEPASVIIPKKAAILLRSLYSKDDENVTMEFGGNNIKFSTENQIYISRAIEGRFPNYNSAIPLQNVNKATVNRIELLNSLKRVSFCSKNGNNLVHLTVGETALNLEAKDFIYSTSAKEKVACSYIGSDDTIEMNLKVSNFIDMLSVLSSEEVSLEFSDSTRAMLLSPLNSEDIFEKSIVMMLMPITA